MSAPSTAELVRLRKLVGKADRAAELARFGCHAAGTAVLYRLKSRAYLDGVPGDCLSTGSPDWRAHRRVEHLRNGIRQYVACRETAALVRWLEPAFPETKGVTL